MEIRLEVLNLENCKVNKPRKATHIVVGNGLVQISDADMTIATYSLEEFASDSNLTLIIEEK